MTDLIEYMKLCLMNTHGEEQDKCLKILAILEEKEKVMVKNIIISVLFVYILNMYDGWAVDGLMRFFVSIVLVALLSILINELEKVTLKA